MTTWTSPIQRLRLHRSFVTVATGLALVACAALFAADASAAAPRRKSHDLKEQVEQLEEQWRTAQLSADGFDDG